MCIIYTYTHFRYVPGEPRTYVYIAGKRGRDVSIGSWICVQMYIYTLYACTGVWFFFFFTLIFGQSIGVVGKNYYILLNYELK